MLTEITKEEVISRLRNAGISPSGPRIAVFHFLCNNHIHPTVDTIFHALSPENPTLSRTTVYNTLKLLLAKNLIQSVKIEDTEVRFDGNPAFHAHFKCRQCDCIMDLFDVPCPAIPQSEDFQIEFVPHVFPGSVAKRTCGIGLVGRQDDGQDALIAEGGRRLKRIYGINARNLIPDIEFPVRDLFK